MHLLDSRASRMTPNQALLTVHADYIGGAHANYRKWYFAAQLDLDDAVANSRQEFLLGRTGTTVEHEEDRVDLLGILVRVGLLGVHVLRLVRDNSAGDVSLGILELSTDVLLVLAQQPGPELDGTRLVNTVNVTESCIWM